MLSPLRRRIDPPDASPDYRLCRALDWDRVPSRRLVRLCSPSIAAEYLAYARAWPALALLFARVPSAAVHIRDLVAVDAHETEATTQAQHIARVVIASGAARRAVGESMQSSISDEERAKRAGSIAQARASVRLEGTVHPLEIEELNRLYVDGQLSPSQHVEKVIEAADAMARRAGIGSE